VDVFWRGRDGALWHKWYDGQWHDHESLGAGPLGSDPRAVAWGPNRLDVFWRGMDGGLWHKWYDGQWHPHERLVAGPIGSDPHAVAWGPNRLDVFWRGGGGALWHLWYDGRWHPAESLGAAAPMPVHGLRGLTEIWLSLETYTDFFAEEAWLSSPSPAMQRIRRLLVDFVATNSDEVERQLATTPMLVELLNRERTAIAAREGAAGLSEDLLNLLPFLPRPAQPALSAAAFMEFLGLSAFHVDAFSAAKDAPSMFNLGPVAARSAGSMDRARVAGWGATGRKLRMAAVSLDSGELRYVTEDGGLVGRTLAPLTREQPSTACAQLDEYVDFLEGELKIARAEKEAKKELADKIERDLEQARKDLADCKARSPSRRVPVTVDVISGMIASASMPAFFPPVPLAAESYVDGGLRAMIPVEAAIRLGADTVIAVTASKSSVDPWHGSKTASTVALRSLMDIAVNEIAFRDVHAPLGFGKAAVTVIEPRVDTHTTFTIYPAFVRNRMAYGYMCAADAIAPPPDPEDAAKARAAADRIHVLRYLAARLECWLVGEPVPPAMVKLGLGDMTGAAVELARIKAEIKSLVAERTRLGAKMPSGKGEWDDPDLWSSRTEIHPWDPFRTTAAPPAKVAVPNVVDDPVGVAETAIRSAGLVPKRKGSTADDTLVLSQNPKAGTLVDVRSTVELTLIEIL
jgi:Patatin-like phospholipase/PASTA domain